MSEVVCPLTYQTNVVLEKKIDAEILIQNYWDKFNIDVHYLFKGINTVNLYKCKDTSFMFYYPHSLSGDDKFYRHFGKYDWYYLPWKWEHEVCTKYINENDKVLEVGAARGDFLKRLNESKKIDGTGLELNSEAVKEANERGIHLINQSIEAHAVENPNKYDVVCSFQVLEHIPNVGQVITSMLHCLKPGGKLIISVPNNDSFIRDNMLPSKILNMPPHHMGLWNEKSLSGLSGIFSIWLIEILTEPLQPAQMDTYQYTQVRKILFNSELLVRIYWKLKIHVMVRPLLKLFANRIRGHSIMGIYAKANK
jgi:2-polyprenyl-3-methyl-5-hydroxy-6-metoxy-1,4-benzoquinol methylase